MFATMEKRPNSVNTAPGCREFTVTAFPILNNFLKEKRAHTVEFYDYTINFKIDRAREVQRFIVAP
jgi:hypothetical protein